MQETLSKELSAGMFKFHESFGYDSAKRANLHLFPAVEEGEGAVIMYAAGNLLILKNLSSGEKTIIRSPAGSVGALAVNHDHSYFAIGGKGAKPPILVYSYPDLKCRNVLQGGAENGFAHVEFSSDGKLLASLSSTPDYMLTLWNWKDQSIVLRCKERI